MNGLITMKSALDVRREMAENPHFISALGPIDRSVFLASVDRPISAYIDTELVAELAKALRFIAKDVGYRDVDESERGYLVVRVAEILKRYYATFSMRDFRMAFEMSITGELDDFLPKGKDGQADRGHYQCFNAEYICKILNAYRMRRARVFRDARKIMPAPEPVRDFNAERAYRNEAKKDCISVFNYYCENGELPPISPIGTIIYYNILLDAGLAPEWPISNDEQKTAIDSAIGRIAGRIENPVMPEKKRRDALENIFAKMVADGKNLTDYITVE